MTRQTMLLFIGAVFGLLIGTIPSLLIFWASEPAPVNYATRVILTPRVAPGEKLRISIVAELTKTTCKATVTRSIIDAFDVVYFVEPETRPAFTRYIAEITIPLGAAPGPAKYRARVEWHCNPLQDRFPLVVLQPELDFEIVPALGQTQIPMKQGAYSKASKIEMGELP